jgi:hypothetical protein
MIKKLDSEVWRRTGATLVLALFVLLASFCMGQQLTGTLSGTALDSSGAVIPDAQVSLKNEASGDTRSTVSNGSGFFSITAIPPGSYTVTVTASGFKTWKETGIVFAQGDNRNLPNISLQVGEASASVEVNVGGATVPLDTAEVSTTLEQSLIQNVPLQGRDAGELLKLMPGMALNSMGAQGTSFNDSVTGTNNGPVGAYSANGTQPNGAMAYMLDGANLVDPGNAGTQIANINQDMVSEVKVLMSSYSAEYAKGPTIFQAFSKSGGKDFHGEGYLYARNSVFNSIDAFTHSQIHPGGLTAAQAAPSQSFYYMGGNIGGPIRLPFTSFNKNRDKLFFWAGYEYMKQQPAGSILNFNVPTADQLTGVFDESAVPAGVLGAFANAYRHPSKNLPAGSQEFLANGTPAVSGVSCDTPTTPACTKTIIPTSAFDPTGVAYSKLYPTPTITPSAQNGFNNYQYVSQTPQNRWEATGKVDYAISDNTKLSASYTRQIENDEHPIGVWWTPPTTLPYPSDVVAATTSQEVMANLTHVFSPTTTNEFVFTLARYINPNQLVNPAAVDRSNLGINVTGLFGHTTSQIPNLVGPCCSSALAGFEEFSFDTTGFSGFGALKRDPAIYDNFTKVIGAHTIKTGVYWDTSENIQSAGGLAPGDNGTFNIGGGPGDTSNYISNVLLGALGSYQQVSSFPSFDIKFHQWSLYAQDSFKANRQLTLNYGLRFDHVGQMYGPPNGMQVWDPATYVNTPNAPANTGLVWNAIDKNIPLSGLSSPLFYYEPRVGLAYDIFGTGKTVLRAGYAIFHYQFAVNDVGGPTSGPAGVFTFNTQGTSQYTGATNTGFAQIDSGTSGFTPPSSVEQNGSSIGAFEMGDNQTPFTSDWNVTVSQATPWRSVFELSYVGNKSQDELINGTNFNLDNLNNVPVGGFFLPDPKTGTAVSPSAPGFNSNDYRPLANYQNIIMITHGSYANYNSLQASWQKQSGPVTFLTNYTFSKVMGIRDGETDNGNGNGVSVDPFSIKNNYGPLAYDHTHILNLSYVWNMPSFIHGNKFAGGAVNGWQLSGYTTFQSGAPLQPGTGGNLNVQYPGGLTVTLPNGLTANGVSPSTWFGTNAPNAVLPVVTCDPRQHAAGLYFNPNCFAPPAYGQQGTFIWPYVKEPAYFDSDLGLFKSFKVTESQSVQFRVSATNFLNHPLPQFGLAGNGDQSLNFSGPGNTLSQTNTNATTTGKPAFKIGSRQVTFALKYYF